MTRHCTSLRTSSAWPVGWQQGSELWKPVLLRNDPDVCWEDTAHRSSRRTPFSYIIAILGRPPSMPDSGQSVICPLLIGMGSTGLTQPSSLNCGRVRQCGRKSTCNLNQNRDNSIMWIVCGRAHFKMNQLT